MNNAPRGISRAENVLALLAHGSSSPPFARLMFAAFDDGTIIWARNRILGGAPYFTANLGCGPVARVLDRLESDGLFSDLHLVGGAVPGSECSCFVVHKDGNSFEFESCHEQFEESGVCLAEHDAITPVGNRQRFDVLARQPHGYIFSRMIWLELRRIIESLIPDTGHLCDGGLEMLGGEFCWSPHKQENAEP